MFPTGFWNGFNPTCQPASRGYVPQSSRPKSSPWWFTGSIPGLVDPSGSKEIAFISEYCPELLDFSASTDSILASDDDPADIIGTMRDIYQSPSGLEHSAEVFLGCIETFLR